VVDLKSTTISIQMANQSVKYPTGILEDVAHIGLIGQSNNL